jgi:hypothetical protein
MRNVARERLQLKERSRVIAIVTMTAIPPPSRQDAAGRKFPQSDRYFFMKARNNPVCDRISVIKESYTLRRWRDGAQISPAARVKEFTAGQDSHAL